VASVKDTVKAVKVGGVEATEATIKDGSYIVQRPFVLVTKSDKKLSASAQKFFDYVTSDKAAAAIASAGVVAAN
ncbi:MAG: phosphate ABC transporter phosphate-binding protein, partial [Oscillospiraceae bacterium]